MNLMELSISLTGNGVVRRHRSYSPEYYTSRGIHNAAECRFLVFDCSTVRIKPLRQTSYFDSKRNSLKVSSYHRNEISTLEAKSIEEIYDSLTERLIQNVETQMHISMKYIVGLAGPPGSGKSTLASEVVRKFNMVWSQKTSGIDSPENSDDIAIVVPMDGFHLYRSQLDAMENPTEAHARRGAPWTFDPALLLKHLQFLRIQESVLFPSFDHGVGDPVEDDILVKQHHKVVIVEGNYLLLEEGLWKEISSVFNEKWFIDIDINKSMERVLKRHISTGKAPHVAKWRIDYNDKPNAELIMKSKRNADVIIQSIDKELTEVKKKK